MSRIIWMAPEDKKNSPNTLKERIIIIIYNTKKSFSLIIFEITQIYKIQIWFEIFQCLQNRKGELKKNAIGFVNLK